MSGFSLLDIVIFLLRNKWRIVLHFIGISVAAVVISYTIPKKYMATTVFLPPQDETSNFNPLALGFSLNLGSASEFSARQIQTLALSRTTMETIVKQFNLMKLYKTEKYPNHLEKAVKILRRNIKFGMSTQSGFAQEIIVNYVLSVVDKDKKRAADMANAIVDILNQTMEDLSHMQESYSVAFIKSRLDSVETGKNAVLLKLTNFQKLHKIYSPEMKDQVLASVGIFAELKKQKMLSEIERDLLLLDNQQDSREVRIAEKKIAQLDRNMRKLESGRQSDVLPSLHSSVDVAREYLELVRESEIQMKLEVLLRQQFEEARIKNARQAPFVRVVDRAVPPQWKNSPKKIVVVAVLVGLYMTVFFILLLAKAGVARSGEGTRRKLNEFKSAMSLTSSRN